MLSRRKGDSLDSLILEPLKYYKKEAKKKHEANVLEHYESLVKSSGVDVAANKKTVAEYDKELATISALDKKIGRYRVGFGMLITLAIIGIVAFIAGIVVAVQTDVTAGVISAILGIVAAVIGFVVAFKVTRPKITDAENVRQAHVKRANELYSEALSQMAPLNALFDDLDTLRLIEKTMPEVKFDLTYSNEVETDLIENYDYIDYTDDDTSIVDTLSGTLFENPFLFERYLHHRMGTQTYHGTKVISWTEYYTDSKGHRRSRRRTQTLHASVTKPKPFYTIHTHLGFGSQAAPDLSFSRTESDSDELSESALERKIKKGEKKLQRRAQEAIQKGGSFQEMTNSEFDVLFGATNRDHEVQFRLMYTPLAQTNTVDLLRSKDGYGDDFNFIKQNRYNVIKSIHAQAWNMDLSPEKYRSHSVDISREKFRAFNEEYFKSVFFDFAPLMAVPAYHAGPVASMAKPKEYDGFYPPYEHEALANAIGARVFAHEAAQTDSILKTIVTDKNGGVDRVSVTSYAYRIEQRVDYVTVFGGDGRAHSVPVRWDLYIPVSKTSEMYVKSLGHTSRELSEKANGSYPHNAAYLHGLMAYCTGGYEPWENIEEIFKKYI